MDPPVRRSSIHSLLGPSDPDALPFYPSSPSPPPPPPPPRPRIAYNPRRITPARSVLVPISRIEIAQSQNPTSNPLRIRPPPPDAPPPATSRQPAVPGLPPKPDFLPQQPTRGEEDRGHGGAPAPSSGARKRPTLLSESLEPQRKRRRSNEDVLAVAGHYNARPNTDVTTRRQSPIFGLKSFNNWVKTVLIGKFGRREDSTGPRVKVLDLGCGKGGDLQKWLRAGTDELIGIDLAAVSVEQARDRWQNMRDRNRYQAAFFTLDCFGHSIEEVLEPVHVARLFDVVSMQFCMHYAFDAEAKVRQMLENVVHFLRPGGVFIGTIPDSYNLLARLEEIPQDDEILAFGNEVYRIQFDERDPTPRYAHRYTFFLTDAVEEVPEYIVYWESFVALALEYGLRLEYHADFQRIFAEEGQDPHFGELLRRMKVVDVNGDTEMTVDQWEAANLYVGFAFVKE